MNNYNYGPGRDTSKPLRYPDARKVEDIFTAAKLGSGSPNTKETGFYYTTTLNGGGGFCGNIGGKMYIVVRKNTDDLFCRGGVDNVFTSTWVKPVAGMAEAMSTQMISRLGAFETCVRNDGRLLVTARDDQQIGTRYVALLDAGETLESLFDDDDQQTLAKHRAYDKRVENCIRNGKVNRSIAREFGIQIRER